MLCATQCTEKQPNLYLLLAGKQEKNNDASDGIKLNEFV